MSSTPRCLELIEQMAAYRKRIETSTHLTEYSYICSLLLVIDLISLFQFIPISYLCHLIDQPAFPLWTLNTNFVFYESIRPP